MRAKHSGHRVALLVLAVVGAAAGLFALVAARDAHRPQPWASARPVTGARPNHLTELITFEIVSNDDPTAGATAGPTRRELVTFHHLFGVGLLMVSRQELALPNPPPNPVPPPGRPGTEFLEEMTLDARDELLLPDVEVEVADDREPKPPVWIPRGVHHQRERAVVAPEFTKPNS